MKAKKLLSMITLSALCLTACGSASIKLQKEKFNVELGEQINTKASTYLAKDTDKDVLKESKVSFKESKSYSVDNKSETLKAKDKDYLPVGKYNGSVKYQDNKKDFIVEIKDTTAPKFVDFKAEISIEVGSEVKLEDYFKAKDLSQVAISINKDKLDITKEGSYETQVTATDQYKNKVTKKFIVKVVEKTKALQDLSNLEGQDGSKSNNYSDSSNVQITNKGNSSKAPPTSNTCTPNGTYGRLGNSGKWFNSMAEAEAWADTVINQRFIEQGKWSENLASQWIDNSTRRPKPGMENVASFELRQDGTILMYKFYPDSNYNYDWDLTGYFEWTIIDSCGEERNDLWTVDWY